ncbi:LSU ribosomal protein L9p [hydrothermal vent metagenome]|uniref:LSU ribosomal protein L9p n=1 Tax=hydrothermal vent metagenome TaxID=652676 RepID=A0A3B1CKQ3_9ZZZZ
MKVILKSDVERLGRMGDLVEVKAGYARNFLLPQSLAALATNKNVKMLAHEKRIIDAKIKKVRLSAEDVAQKVAALSLSIPAQVGEEGKLFGSVVSKDIADAMLAAGMEIDKRKILLDKPIKALGVFQIPVKIHHDVSASVKVEVVARTENTEA